MGYMSDYAIRYEEDHWEELAEELINRHRDEWEELIMDKATEAMQQQEEQAELNREGQDD